MGGLSFVPSLGQHWLLNLDWQSMFKSQETSITLIPAYPAALGGKKEGLARMGLVFWWQ